MEKLVIAETDTAMWNYHLRNTGNEKMVALCGRALGWDTAMPLEAYGQRDHIPSNYCKVCVEVAIQQGYTYFKRKL